MLDLRLGPRFRPLLLVHVLAALSPKLVLSLQKMVASDCCMASHQKSLVQLFFVQALVSNTRSQSLATHAHAWCLFSDLPLQVLKNAVLYVLLAPYDHEQSDLLHRVMEEKKVSLIPSYKWVIRYCDYYLCLLMYILSLWLTEWMKLVLLQMRH